MVNSRIIPATHHGINCDNCGMVPIVGHRFRCINCIDFDLCSSCEELNPHDHKHTFLKIRIPIPGAVDTFPFIPAPLSLHHAVPSPGIIDTANPNTNPIASTTPQQRGWFHQPGLHPEVPLSRGPSLPRQLHVRPDLAPLSFIDTVNQFGFRLQSQYMLTQKKCSNGVAAANIYRCLMMAAAGSEGINMNAFAEVLGFDASSDALGVTVQNIVRLDKYCKPCPTKDGGAVELAIGSSVWPGKSIGIEPLWAKQMEQMFEATIAPQEVHAMNAWARESTRGKIRSVVGEEAMSDQDIKLMTSLYFKAKWDVPFDPYKTYPGAFFGFDEEALAKSGVTRSGMHCSMMQRTSDILYMEDNVAQMCVLPYQTKDNNMNKPQPSPFLPSHPNPTSLTIFGNDNGDTNGSPIKPAWNAAIILPKIPGAKPILDILSHFSTFPSTLRTVCVKRTYLHLTLPRFTLKQSADLSELLFKLGLRPVSHPSPYFSPMTPSKYAYISSIKHDLVVEVNEKGTEVAAVTTIGVFGAAAPTRVPVEMKVDRPFLFLVFDSRSGSVLCSAVISEVAES
ncbi:hypothetical protein EMPG_11950 [Blastomyces silverae]|uniref:ZZ-type domain-containing protein n=1 Tax=Blastomyces silverae TaxID=2060906 RepID=A0A0H1BNG9_9EURO|nr:hypothetical protein EMPG_11950 [Blastomyces silverae]